MNDGFLFKIGTYESVGMTGGYNISADIVNFGIYNKSDISGPYGAINWNTPLVGGSVVFDEEFNLSGFTLGCGPGGFGVSGSAGTTITHTIFEF